MQIAYTLSPKEVRKITGKKLRAALAGFFAASALVAGTAISPPAHAAPAGCATGWGTDNRAYGNCSQGTGQYRLGIPCKTVFTAFTAYSGWKNVRQPVVVECPFGSWVWRDIPGGARILVEKRG